MFPVGMRGAQTGQTRHFQAAAHGSDVDERNPPDGRHVNYSLRLHFLFLMHLFNVLFSRLGWLSMVLIWPRVTFLLQKGGNARPPRRSPTAKRGILLPLNPQSVWPPARMCCVQLAQSLSPWVLISTSPFAEEAATLGSSSQAVE